MALRLYELCLSGDVEAASYSEFVTRVNAAISGKHGVAGVKAAMELAGYRAGIPRRPLLPLDEAAVAELRRLAWGDRAGFDAPTYCP